MTLAKAFGDHEALARGGVCTICRALDELPEADANALRAALADRSRFSGVSIERLLRAEGINAGSGAANRHRRAECK
jgi:hypothetical protein